MSETIKKLTDLFSKFPTIGQRTAGRFVSYLIRQPQEKINELAEAIKALKANINFCAFCFNPYESQNQKENNFCQICRDPIRIKSLLCIVEKESDLIAIENTKKYKGLYFILDSSVSVFKKNGENSLRLNELKESITNPKISETNFVEIIIATNPTPEGRSISMLVERTLRELANISNIKITHLAKGLPIGGELEYADEETLEEAFQGRK